MVMISERPAEVADRAVPGHWEGDLIIGSGSSAIGTLVERTTRFVLLLHLPRGHDAAPVRDAMAEPIDHAARPAAPVADLGPGHARWPTTPGSPSPPACTVYFCDPHSALAARHQREHQRAAAPVLPQGHQPAQATAREHLDAVAAELNGRPRKTLGWRTPAQALSEALTAAA